MQRFIKSAFLLVTLFCFMASLAFASPREELDALYKDMNKVNNGRATLQIDGKAMEHTFNVFSKLNFESRPTTLIRGEVELNVTKKGETKPKKDVYEFYVEDEGKQYVYYYTEKGKNKWYKDVVKEDDVEKEKKAAEKTAAEIDPKMIEDLTGNVEYDSAYTNAAKNETGYKVTVDMAKVVDVISIVASESASKDKSANIDMLKEFGKSLPPVNYTVVGDTKKGEVKAVYMPLTDFLKGGANAIVKADNLDPMIRLMIVAALKDATLDIKAEGFDYNKVKVEKLPNDVKKKAKQVEKKDDKKKK